MGTVILQHGPTGQMTDCPEAARLRPPALFASSLNPSGIQGPFIAVARGFSVQMWANRHRTALAGGSGLLTTGTLALRR